MKTIKRFWDYIIVVMITYVISALVSWNLDPNDWTTIGRIIVSVFLFVIFVIIFSSDSKLFLLIPLMIVMMCCNPSERIKYPDQKTSYKQANKSKTYPVPNKRKQARARTHCIEYKHDFSPKRFPQ